MILPLVLLLCSAHSSHSHHHRGKHTRNRSSITVVVDPRDKKAESYYEIVKGVIKDAKENYPELQSYISDVSLDLDLIQMLPVADPLYHDFFNLLHDEVNSLQNAEILTERNEFRDIG